MTIFDRAGILVPLVIAFGIAALLTRALVRSPAWRNRFLNRANERSLHTGAIPRSGGIALLGGLGSGILVAGIPKFSDTEWRWLLGALVLIGWVSLLDDARGLGPRTRLLAHVLAAGLLILGGLAGSPVVLPGWVIPLPPLFAIPLSLLLIVWSINLYNFMDGMDGLAGTMALFGFGTLALFGWRGDDLPFLIANGAIAAAALGFLLYNRPPARIFLGDLGSTTLGLLMAALSLMGAQRGLFPLWVAGLLFSPFLVDATSTLIRRALGGEILWHPHRTHHYQRLILSGWSHGKTLSRAAVLMAACAATALAAPTLGVREQWWLLGAWTLIYAMLSYRLGRRERRIPS